MARKASTPNIEEKPHEIDGVPTADGLVALGRTYARRVPGGIHITPIGHAIIGDALRAKAHERLARGEGNWEQPPSRTDLGVPADG